MAGPTQNQSLSYLEKRGSRQSACFETMSAAISEVATGFAFRLRPKTVRFRRELVSGQLSIGRGGGCKVYKASHQS